ncbi:MAG TPA: hypothetical protein VGV61_08240 [Thermoanaerobaculia bacterium]|jgi:hypothetical protein|nr:hypothetical protein [Thermoanaerobaculia bacterium]
MAVVLPVADEPGEVGGRDLSLDSHTGAATHEIAEAYTDTKGVGPWRLKSKYPTDPWRDVLPWVRDSGTIELADLAKGSRWFETDPVSGLSFRYTRVYGSFLAVLGFTDVSVPPQTNPVYGVFTPLGNLPNDWHGYTAPTQVSIPVTAWAQDGVGSFTVTASISTSGGQHADPCSLPVTSWPVSDGSTFQLLIDVVPVTDHVWCTIELDSACPSPPPNDDTKHLWMVGVLALGSL